MNWMRPLLSLVACVACAAQVGAAPPELTVEHVPGQKALRVKVRNAPEGLRSWTLSLSAAGGDAELAAAGGSRLDPAGVLLKLPKLAGGLYQLSLRLDDGVKPITVSRPLVVNEKGACVLDVKARILFRPVYNELVVQEITAPERLKAWALKILPEGADNPVFETSGELPFTPAKRWGTLHKTPDLPVGAYRAVLSLTGEGQAVLVPMAIEKELPFRYAYFPSHRIVRLLVPDTPVARAALTGNTGWQAVVTPRDQEKALATETGTFPFPQTGVRFDVGDLPEGEYTLTLTVSAEGEPIVVRRPFERRHFEWEGLDLGTEDVVIPPFTPLKADAGRHSVSCVQREHVHGGAGLWKQVTSQGRELLAGPVRLEATSGGKTIIADGTAIEFGVARPNRVTGKAVWKAGALSGTTAVDYDYDGFMQMTLRLAPTEAEIDRLQLVIPLKASEAWLMHPVTTGLRQHYAGRVPALRQGSGQAGQGKVWDSSGVPSKVGGYFVPYLFLGGPERGICFAADNDRDWIRGDDAPMMEIDRRGDTVNLRLNLIASASRLSRERIIKFALQATPAKPMPEKPYNWRRWYTTGTARDAEDVQIRFWGGNMYWGGRLFATSVFPAGKDYAFWEQLAESRRTGKRNPEFEKQWLARFEKLPAKDYNNLRAHFNAGLSWAPGTPAVTAETKKFNYVIPYTNPRGANRWEDVDFGTTYLDEWQTIGIADPSWDRSSTFERVRRDNGSATWYHIEPVPTRVDMLLYYHRKMFETFADGIYWDNFFLRSCYILPEAGGPAYVADDGTLRPGVNLTYFRSLAKRTAVMMHTMGKRPLIYIHMTNTNIVPMLSFGTLNLDWEWRDQGAWALKDLQDRLGSDRDTALILAQSMGLKSGNISVAIDRFRPPKNSGITRQWLFRTVMAVCLPHEIKVYQGTREVSAVQNQMAEFGYGLPECKVYRYWEDGFPLKTDGAKTHALVLARDGKAMLAVGNHGPGKEPAEKSGSDGDAPALKEYDAGQRGLKKPTDQTKPDAPADKDETYTVTLKLDLQALGLAEGVRAFDAEQQARNAAAKTGKRKQPAADPKPAELKRIAPGVFELTIKKHDFALIVVE